MNSLPAFFGCQIVNAIQNYRIFLQATFLQWCDTCFNPKDRKGTPFGDKKSVLKVDNIGIKSCVMMPLNTP